MSFGAILILANDEFQNVHISKTAGRIVERSESFRPLEVSGKRQRIIVVVNVKF